MFSGHTPIPRLEKRISFSESEIIKNGIKQEELHFLLGEIKSWVEKEKKVPNEISEIKIISNDPLLKIDPQDYDWTNDYLLIENNPNTLRLETIQDAKNPKVVGEINISNLSRHGGTSLYDSFLKPQKDILPKNLDLENLIKKDQIRPITSSFTSTSSITPISSVRSIANPSVNSIKALSSETVSKKSVRF